MTLLRRHPILASLFAIALILTLFFAGRFVAQVVYWSDPARREQEVAGWMTLRYVARSWHLSPLDLYDAAGLPPSELGQRRTLDQLVEDRGIPLPQLIAEVEAAIARLVAKRANDLASDGDSAP